MKSFLLQVNRPENLESATVFYNGQISTGDGRYQEWQLGDTITGYDSFQNVIKISIPLTATEQLFHRVKGSRLWISNDLRVLKNEDGLVDESGLFSLLQFGTVIPPWTIYQNVKQFVPGFEHQIDLVDFSINSSLLMEPLDAVIEEKTISGERLNQHFVELLDQVLVDECPNKDPIILFSGGVDSGLLASRAAALEWRETELFNYSFGPTDKEAQLAKDMSRALGLKFIQTENIGQESFLTLKKAGELFRAPFGDHSSIPTYELIAAVIKKYGTDRVVLDGTGADGLFGFFKKSRQWDQLEKVPIYIRRILATHYKEKSLWKRHGRREDVIRVVRRSSFLPPVAAVIANNPLYGIAYEFDDKVVEDVIDQLTSWIQCVSGTNEIEVNIPLADVVVTCCRIFTQKNKSILDEHGFNPKYPYMDQRLVRFAIQEYRIQKNSYEPKAIIKELLANSVGNEMVYRPKSGFVGPIADTLAKLEFQGFIDDMISSDSYVSHVINRAFIKDTRELIRDGVSMSPQIYDFIWTAVFADQWLRQVSQQNDFQTL